MTKSSNNEPESDILEIYFSPYIANRLHNRAIEIKCQVILLQNVKKTVE